MYMSTEKKSPYFDGDRSVYDACGEQTERILSIIAGNYMGKNPPLPVRFRGFYEKGILCNEEGRFDMDLNRFLPESKTGQISFVRAKFYREAEGVHVFSMKCFGPARIWLNNKEVFCSGVRDESRREAPHRLEFFCRAGWNEVVLRLKKTTGGFGCVFGVQDAGWAWITFLNPCREQEGKLGFAYTEAMDEKEAGRDLENLEKAKWLPEDCRGEEENIAGKIYGEDGKGKYLYGWSAFSLKRPDTVTIAIDSCGDTALFIDGEKLAEKKQEGEQSEEVRLKAGKHEILVRGRGETKAGWKIAIRGTDEGGGKITLTLPHAVSGIRGPWLYLGPFADKQEEVEKQPTLYGLFGEEKRYWRADAPGVVIRPALENTAFGKWNYPLGVTLYGLTRLARCLDNQEMLGYVKAHMQECIRLYEYSLWDKKQYGFPEVNNQLARISTLDDCGSFGSAMLELKDSEVEAPAGRIADAIAEHMEKKQSRCEGGGFFRIGPKGFPDATMWADDLYMSVPFLCRYYLRTGNGDYLDDAARQFRRFKEYLYMPEKQILSHVYDFMMDTATGMPWGRGNGWCFFSLTELLEVMPETHKDYPFLIRFYQELAEGYMRLQGKSGMWHQLLTHPDSYEETSCTSMFVYGLCRGLRFGWLAENQRGDALEAVRRGWHGIISRSVDRGGNVYGICRGSSYSFTPEYYKEELLWIVNDPHGIGIVLLAGIETMALTEAF